MTTRILIVSSEFPPGPGGIGHHAWYLAKEICKKENTTVEVLCPKDYASTHEVLKFDKKAPFTIHRFERKKGLTYILRLLKLVSLLRGNEYTHFWCTGKFALWMIWVQKIFAPKTKTLGILHGSEVNLNNFILRKFTHQSIAQFQTIVSVSLFTQELLPKWILKKHSNLRIIPNGLDKSDFTFSKDVNLKGVPALLTVGHVSLRKGQHRLIKSLPQIIKKFPNVHYHMVGRPIEQFSFESLALSLNVQEHITFHGSIKEHSDLWAYYAAADIFILLSENQKNGDVEGFGIVALEANACGTPVLGAKYCGVEEATSHKESGYLVDGNSAEEILEGIQFCVEHKNLLEQSSVAWANKHEWSIIKSHFEKCL
jgi:phosphatidylinositol alpha-1,6-mannosyltransferase